MGKIKIKYSCGFELVYCAILSSELFLFTELVPGILSPFVRALPVSALNYGVVNLDIFLGR